METQEQRRERLSKTGGWIGVDFDGTLAHYEGWDGTGDLGRPIAKMVERIRGWRAKDITVRIFTARVGNEDEEENKESARKIFKWCVEHIGEILPVTCTKNNKMIELWDDRAIQVIQNTGERADGRP